MKALLYERKEARFVAAAAMSRIRPGVGASVGPLKLTDIAEPSMPGPGWQRVRPILSGICGSDLSTIDGHTSRYFESLVSFPFVPGHEVVGRTDDGRRVLIEPVLGAAARLVGPQQGVGQADGHDYGHLITGPLEPGLQIGSCASTGGGWSEVMVAHESQLHELPDDLDDAAALVVEPVAAGIHGALKANIADGATVAVLGAGMMGLAAIAGLRHLTGAGTIVAGAKYPHQRRLAAMAGADVVVGPDEVARSVRRIQGSGVIGTRLAGGADAVIDAVGNSASITDAIGIARPRGRVVMLGMPGNVQTDLAALWHRETELVGSYCYGGEHSHGGQHTFELAMKLVRELNLGQLVSATYKLKDYRTAIDHAVAVGPRGGVRIAFAPNG